MGIIAWIIFGLIAGIIAKLIMPGRDGGGFFLTCILGIVGAVWSFFCCLHCSAPFLIRCKCSPLRVSYKVSAVQR